MILLIVNRYEPTCISCERMPSDPEKDAAKSFRLTEKAPASELMIILQHKDNIDTKITVSR